jgi:dTDP-4-amino-4,6-dideoxygalactose transaminase
MRDSYLVFGRPHIEEDEIAEVVATLRSGWLGTGPKTAQFEREFAAYCEAPCAVAVSSCTAALHLSLMSVGAGPGTGVITSPLTFASTANVVFHRGAELFLVDIDLDTLNLSPAKIEEFLARECDRDGRSGRPRHRASGAEIVALMPVHFAGRPCDMEAIEAIARRHRLKIVEDAAHAIEARVGGRKIGSIGDLTCFSFYATKNVTTGEGGMITLADEEVAATLRTTALHGLSLDAWKRFSNRESLHYEVMVPGYKYNLTDIAASIGLHQLRRVERNLARREAIWARYDHGLAGLPLVLPPAPAANSRHARHLYTLLVDPAAAGIDRDELRRRLHVRNIGTGIHFVSVHLHEFYRRHLGLAPEDLPNANCVSERTLSLPLAANLDDRDIDDVIEAVHDSLRR